MKKWLTHLEDITIINIYASDDRATKYMKQYSTESKGDRQFNNNC